MNSMLWTIYQHMLIRARSALEKLLADAQGRVRDDEKKACKQHNEDHEACRDRRFPAREPGDLVPLSANFPRESITLAALGLSEDSVGDSRLLKLLEQISAPEAASNSSAVLQKVFELVEFIRLVRQLRRFDLITLCSAISAEKDDNDEVACELILLYVDAESWQELYSFLHRRTKNIFPLHGSDLLNIVSKLLPAQSGSLEVWPNESLVYAEKTAILNINMAVALRQRALIESLLKAVEGV